ncbi:MAG: Gfo/Idh/MocA family protein, partial [Rubrobacteraceae bacterium]
PVALNASDARRLSRVVRETGNVLLPGHILRFVPQYALVKDRLLKGEAVRSVFLRRNVPRERFGRHGRTHPVLMSLSHDIDLLLWFLADQRPERVYAVERRISGSDNPDVFWGIVEFSGGTVACLESLWTVPDGGGRYVDVELEVSTVARMITVKNPDDAVTIIDGEKPVHPALSVDAEVGGRRFGALKEELVHFVAVARGEVQPVVSVDDAVEAIALGEALIQSAKTRAPVELSGSTS